MGGATSVCGGREGKVLPVPDLAHHDLKINCFTPPRSSTIKAFPFPKRQHSPAAIEASVRTTIQNRVCTPVTDKHGLDMTKAYVLEQDIQMNNSTQHSTIASSFNTLISSASASTSSIHSDVINKSNCLANAAHTSTSIATDQSLSSSDSTDSNASFLSMIASAHSTPPSGYIPGGLPAPIPDDDDQRVARLLEFKVLDTTEEDGFDQIAWLAKQICDVPIALVTFVDKKREFFKAKIGIENVSEVPREIAFCSYTILDVNNVFVVPDAATDIRFADNPAVVGGFKLRFYAGAPIISRDGHGLGSVCAIDYKPRMPTPDQIKALQFLASQCITQLELRDRIYALSNALSELQLNKRSLCAAKEHAEMMQREAEKASQLAEIARIKEKKRKVEAEAAKLEADRANVAKSDFLASMSHEIRTPLHGVLGVASLLAETTLTNEQSEFVSMIQVSGEHLLTVLNDILDFSKHEAGKLTLQYAPAELCAVVEQAIQLTYRADVHSHIDVYYTIDTQAPCILNTDITRLRQILSNLISNALKFSTKIKDSTICSEVVDGKKVKQMPIVSSCEERGQVWIEVKLSKEPPSLINGFRLHITVHDKGIGMDPENVMRLFTAFTQVHKNQNYGGTGLGLTISEKLIKMMKGRIWVESALGKGASFHFTLSSEHVTNYMPSNIDPCTSLSIITNPFTQATHPISSSAGSNKSETSTIDAFIMILVHSNIQLCQAFQDHFRNFWSTRLLLAQNQNAAFLLLGQAAIRNRLCCVMFNHSPEHGLDVLDFTTRLRAIEDESDTCVSLPIIAFLPAQFESNFDSTRCNVLCSASLRQPILFKSLKPVVENILSSLQLEGKHRNTEVENKFKYSDASVVRPPVPAANRVTNLLTSTPLVPSPIRTNCNLNIVSQDKRKVQIFRDLQKEWPLNILCVDDNPINLRLLRKMMQNMGYTDSLTCANDGDVAYELIVKQGKHFDLVLIDKVMARCSGPDCTRAVLQWWRKEKHHVPEPVFVAMTASAMDSDKSECLESGAAAFLSKPVNIQRLQDVIVDVGKSLQRQQRSEK